MKMVNLGCGDRFNDSWENYDFYSEKKEVKFIDLRKSLPFKNESIDCIYNSHVLEHFEKYKAKYFLQEIYRVLKPGGIIRVVVPDLEKICREYLNQLDQAVSGGITSSDKYEWMMLELLDQMVRTKSGGLMVDFLKSNGVRNKDFIIDRCGEYIGNLINQMENKNVPIETLKKVRNDSNFNIFNILLSLIKNIGNKPVRAYRIDQIKNKLLKKLMGVELYALFEVAKFREKGEIHQWMYDHFSLKQLLLNVGFIDPKIMKPYESRIPLWETYNLDCNLEHKIYKNDSLIIEAIK